VNAGIRRVQPRLFKDDISHNINFRNQFKATTG